MKPPDNPVFARILAAAEHARLTLRELSDLCGFPRTHVYRWRQQNPSAKSLAAIARVTACNAHWLLTGEGDIGAPDRYPGRAHCIAACRALGIPDEAIERLRQLDPGQDRPAKWWFAQIPAAALPQTPAAPRRAQRAKKLRRR